MKGLLFLLNLVSSLLVGSTLKISDVSPPTESTSIEATKKIWPLPEKTDEEEGDARLQGSVFMGMSMNFNKFQRDNVKKLMNHCALKQCKVLILMKDVMPDLLTLNETTKNLFKVGEPKNKPGGTRTGKISYLRNLLVDEYMNNSEFKNSKYFFMTDLDGVVRFDPLELKKLTRGLGKPGWDMLAFNAARYYDWFAFRCTKETPNCYHKNGNNYACNGRTVGGCSNEWKNKNETDMVEVASAFGGIAIYKRESVGECRYDGIDEKDPQGMDCEHVKFHKCMRQKGAHMFVSMMKLDVKWPRSDVKFAKIPPGFVFIPGYGDLINTTIND